MGSIASKEQLTKLILGFGFEPLVVHQLLYPSDHRLHMVDYEFIKIGIDVLGIDHKLPSQRLTGWIRITVSDIWRKIRMRRQTNGNGNTDVLVQLLQSGA